MSDARPVRVTEVDGTQPEGIAEAARALRSGGFVVHPTSTVYGIGAAATAAQDAEIARLKGRSLDKPLIRLAPSVETLAEECRDLVWDQRAHLLAAEFWPGSLTIILPDGTAQGVAVRVDSHPVTASLLTRWGRLMSSTSLNAHGSAPSRTPDSVRSFLSVLPQAEVPIVFVDAGALPHASPSTLVSLLVRPARVLRVGGVPVEDVRRCIGTIEEVHVG